MNRGIDSVEAKHGRRIPVVWGCAVLWCLFAGAGGFADTAALPVRLPGARIPESLLRESRRVAGEGERWLEKRGEAAEENLAFPMRGVEMMSDSKRERVVNYLRWLTGQGFFNDVPKGYPMVVWGWATQLLDALPPSLSAEAGVPTEWRTVVANQVVSRQRADGGWGDALETRWAV